MFIKPLTIGGILWKITRQSLHRRIDARKMAQHKCGDHLHARSEPGTGRV